MPPLPFQSDSLGVSPEVFNPWWEQFQLNCFPNGTADGTYVSVGMCYALTSAQLLALQSTAVLLVAAPTPGGMGNLVPPNGYAFIPLTLALEFVPGGTPYTIGNADNAFQIEYVGKTTNLLSMTATGLVDQSVVTWAQNSAAVTGTKFSKANSSNLGLELKLVGTTPALTLGNGTVNLYLNYSILPLQ